MKNIILAITFVLSSMSLFAQESLTDSLPLNPEINYGRLPNGFTYYIMHNEKPKNRAELVLTVNAGSVFEDDDQQGLAHFLEHMAFNGTKNFPKHELVDYLESIGMKYGPEVNAYTSFDRTVYKITVPLDSIQYLHKGLLILSDWAYNLTLDSIEIEKERGVIYEEYRMRLDANTRIMQEEYPILFKGSKYAERNPIGKPEVFSHCPHEALKRFYKDWYRPDLMAITVVGDFDTASVREKVVELFGDIPAPAKSRPYEIIDIPEHDDTLVNVMADKELSYSLANIIIKLPREDVYTYGNYRQSIINQLCNGMMGNRLNELKSQMNPPFIHAMTMRTTYLGKKDLFYGVVITETEKQLDGLKTLLVEYERAERFGFEPSEFEREKKSIMRSVEAQYVERHNQPSGQLAGRMTDHFALTKKPLVGIDNAYQIYKQYLQDVTLEEVNATIKRWMTDDNRVVFIEAPEKEDTQLPSEEDVFVMLRSVKDVEVHPYVDKVRNEPLFTEKVTPGKVVEEKYHEDLDYHTFELSNGINVTLKQTDFKKDEILLSAYSNGGSSICTDENYISMQLATDVLAESGLGSFSKIELEKLLSDKKVGVSPFIESRNEGLRGSSSPEDVELMFQMAHLYFVKPKFEKDSYDSFMQRLNASLENKSMSPEASYRDTISIVKYNNSFRRQPLSQESLKQADFAKMETLYKERFGDPSSFNFFIVGNISIDSVKVLSEKYLGSLKGDGNNEVWKDNNGRYVKGIVKETMYRGEENKAQIYYNFNGSYDYNLKSRFIANIMNSIIDTKLIKEIREENSNVYSIRTWTDLYKNPYEGYNFRMFYSCDPLKVDTIYNDIDNIIKKYQKDGPDALELETAKLKLLRGIEIGSRENNFWLSVFRKYHFNEEPYSQLLTREKVIKEITEDDIKAAFVKMFDWSNNIKVELLPANMKK